MRGFPAELSSSCTVLLCLARYAILSVLLQVHLLLELHHPAAVQTGRSSKAVSELHEVSLLMNFHQPLSHR